MLTLHYLCYMLSLGTGNKKQNKPAIMPKELNMEKNQYQRELEKLRTENAQLKEQLEGRQVFIGKNGNICCRVKGRTPVNLYKDQWETILDNANRLKEMLVVHGEKLAFAPENKDEQDQEQVA